LERAVEFADWKCYIIYNSLRIRTGVNMVVDESINTALNRIADAIEENNDVLNRIASHYDGVVPVMTRNAKRVEEAHEKAESSFLGNLFGEPETTN
jgi:hypothetical protein